MALIWGVLFLSWRYHRHQTRAWQRDDRYHVLAIVQRAHGAEALRTQDLAELLGLSCDRPSHLYALNLETMRQQLLRCPAIRRAEVRRVHPDILYVDYEMHTPIAFYADYENVAIDADGWVFPITPYFTPKRLPQFFLGNASSPTWDRPLTSPELQLARTVLACLETTLAGSVPIQIDASNAYSQNMGRREVVALLQCEHMSGTQFYRLLRFLPDRATSCLAQCARLTPLLNRLYDEASERGDRAIQVVDMRSPHLVLTKVYSG